MAPLVIGAGGVRYPVPDLEAVDGHLERLAAELRSPQAHRFPIRAVLAQGDVELLLERRAELTA